jgi:hypothetical protein
MVTGNNFLNFPPASTSPFNAGERRSRLSGTALG